MSFFSSNFLFTIVGAVATEQGQPADQVGEQLEALQSMCAQSEKTRADRHKTTPLYERLGGYDKIRSLTTEIVRLHNKNGAIKHFFDGVDADNLARHVADFMASGTGGNVEYTGRSMVEAHQTMGLSDADFLSAGGDVIQAMENLDYDQDEIDEVVCILVSLKDQVVLK